LLEEDGVRWCGTEALIGWTGRSRSDG